MTMFRSDKSCSIYNKERNVWYRRVSGEEWSGVEERRGLDRGGGKVGNDRIGKTR